jgi:ethanolamine utilization microcompartment shell protein EutS
MWLDRIQGALVLHGDEGAVIESASAQYEGLFEPAEYGL